MSFLSFDSLEVHAYTRGVIDAIFLHYIIRINSMAMFQRDENVESKDVETVIGSSVKVDGNFVGAGDVVVEGHMAGTLKTSKNLRVGEQAVIKADVEAANVIIAGEVRGHVVSRGRVEILASGKVFGNVDAQTIAVAHGAVLHGKVSMVGHEVAEPKSAK